MRAHEATESPSRTRTWVVAFAVLLGACSCDADKGNPYIWHPDANPPVDSGFDSGFDAGDDSGFDSGVDSGMMTMDSGMDSGMMMDAGVDSGPIGITCAVDHPTLCANAGNEVITIAPGEIKGVSGRVDIVGDDYFTVNFTGTAGVLTPYHPKIAIVTNPGNVYSLDVLSSCGNNAVGCATDDQTFEMSFPGTSGTCNFANHCQDNDTRQSTFIVRVHRTGIPLNCFTYTIEISNQP